MVWIVVSVPAAGQVSVVLELAAFCLTSALPFCTAFRALLQIRAVRKKPGALSPVSFSPVLAQSVDHDEHSVSASSVLYWGA